jgi:predicted transcriptional regulator
MIPWKKQNHTESPLNKEQRFSVEAAALILQMASTCSHSNDNCSQVISVKMKLEKILSGSKDQVTEYLSLLQKKGLIRYQKNQGLYIPTDKGMHFLQIYQMLASFLI